MTEKNDSTRTNQKDSGVDGSSVPYRIGELVDRLGLGPNDVDPYGWYKGKLALGLDQRLPSRPKSRYVGVTAISPTPFGEGKTLTSIGLAMGLSRLGHKTIATLRQPSQGPVFGIKGGGAGGGKATLHPFDEINLHFTGDIHAVASANNLLAAMLDNHLKRRLSPQIEPGSLTWRRSIDVNDKGLSRIVSGLGDNPQAPIRETGFDLTAASEVMAILALATSLADLRQRIGRIIVGESSSGEPVTAEQIGCAGSMTALLRDAIRPNLVQTCEGTPVLVHAGPFANIAHGNSSVVADLAATKLADYVVTEAGFGADCGAEKLFHIKCRTSGLTPSAMVVVCTARALKLHSGRFHVQPGKPIPGDLLAENPEAIREGGCNLAAHLGLIKKFGLPAVVAINRFPGDTDRELEMVRQVALESGAVSVAISDAFAQGGSGATELAKSVIAACEEPNQFHCLYPLEASLEEKLQILATEVYGAAGVEFEPAARRRLNRYRELGFGNLPVCVAKTQYSLSHDPKLLGRPTGFRFPIRDVRLSAGAGFVYALAGEISTLPGLPGAPAALRIDIDGEGKIRGLS